MRINCKLTVLVLSHLGPDPKPTDVNGNLSTASILALVLNFCGKIWCCELSCHKKMYCNSSNLKIAEYRKKQCKNWIAVLPRCSNRNTRTAFTSKLAIFLYTKVNLSQALTFCTGRTDSQIHFKAMLWWFFLSNSNKMKIVSMK